ncbi:fumarylacetoacetate hydrolase family protein [Roseateles toxinivorans]|uniref:2-keto-4-pentenoate hydratase n=1 Tax=Roseateles toxinivorans TaxID=270368 RepID=A0A4R6QK04_9BURK|nr:fumarylacetoacetate hydrolase family protein [Roseateles toxinivorans]TDP64066.1 2-keto-4-pentenoate hydratase [Roseateles toxinivorans]
MSPISQQGLTDCLIQARRQGLRPSALDWADALDDPAAAYAVQDRVAAALDWFGDAPPRYWKSGGPSRDTDLTHAALPPAAVRASPADFSDLTFHGLGIEAEVALRLSLEVSPALAAELTPAAAESLIAAMTVSVEVVASRWLEAGAAPALLRLADQQSHGALALGEWLPYQRRDWAQQRCEVQIGDQPIRAYTGTHSLGDPAWLLPQWLRHLTRDGASVPAGTIVTTGTWCGLLPASAGDRISVAFDGLGQVSLRL